MFICDKCVKDYYIDGGENRLRFTLVSYGPCEDCHKTTKCYDIHHNFYAHKKSVVGKDLKKRGCKTIGELRK
jgi:hypothetical protein